MSTAVAVIAGCAAVTWAIKAAGPLALGGRELPGWFTSVVVLLAPALFAALVVTQALADGLIAWRTGSVIGCVVAAAAVTAALRAL